jgi:Flp pilus assembly protein TadD
MGGAEKHERRGSSFFDVGRYVDAENSYREAIKLDPGRAQYFHNLATALFAQNRYDSAESAEREAVRRAPGNAEYHNNLGRFLLAQERYREAEAEFRESLKLRPEQPSFLNDLGRSLFPQGRHDEAEVAQRQAIKIVAQPDAGGNVSAELHSQFWNNLGDNLFQQGRNEEAKDAYREACRLDASSARNHNDFGATLCLLGDYAEAADELRAALDADPGNALFHNNLAAALFALRGYEQAERESRTAVELDDQATYHHDLGAALFMQRRYSEAESEFLTAVRLNGADARCLNSLSLCLVWQQRFADAEAAVRQAIALDIENSKYSDNLLSILAAHAQYAIAQSDFVEAATALRKVMLIRPGDARNHDSLASVLFVADLLAEAETEQHAAISLDPGTGSYYYNLGAILLARVQRDDTDGQVARATEMAAVSRAESGMLREAREAFQQAVQLEPGNASYKGGLSAVFFAQRRYRDAETQLREAILLEPENDTYQSDLAFALFMQQRLAEAESAYRNAARLGKDKGKHYDNLGTALLINHKAPSAVLEYRRAIELAETADLLSDYRLHLVAALSAQGKHQEAVAQLSGMVKDNPDDPVYRDELATAQYHLRAYKEAEDEERIAISLVASGEQKITYYVNLARILIHQQRLAEAERELEELSDAKMDSASVCGLLGYIMDLKGQAAEAEANYRRSLAVEVNVTVRCNLGILLARNRRFNEAAEESFRALEESPSAWMPHYALGLLALEQADEYNDDTYYDDGANHFKQAISAFNFHALNHSQNDTEATLHLNLGYAHGKMGQSARALAEFRSAKKISRQHSRTWFTADANMRRYRRREQSAGSQRAQLLVFSGLGLVVLAITGTLEWRNRLTAPYLVTLLTLSIALFIIAFYLPIVTNIKFGPVSLEKQAVVLRSEPPQPLPSPGNSLDSSFGAWEDIQLAQAVDRLGAATVRFAPAAPAAQATPQETPPLPQPLGARLSESSSSN